MKTEKIPLSELGSEINTNESGFDRRACQRYRVDANIRAYVEHRFMRHAGRILDLSAGGFRMSTAVVPKVDISQRDRLDLDLGEIEYQGKSLGGFGQIVHYKRTPSGLEIGFAWDAQVVIRHHDAITDLIAHLVEQRGAGSVSCVNGIVVLSGHISDALSGDLLSALNGKSACQIVVGESSTIGDSGVDMLIDIQRRGFGVKYCQPEIQYIIARVSQMETRAAYQLGC